MLIWSKATVLKKKCCEASDSLQYQGGVSAVIVVWRMASFQTNIHVPKSMVAVCLFSSHACYTMSMFKRYQKRNLSLVHCNSAH